MDKSLTENLYYVYVCVCVLEGKVWVPGTIIKYKVYFISVKVKTVYIKSELVVSRRYNG